MSSTPSGDIRRDAAGSSSARSNAARPGTVVDICELAKVYGGWSIGGRRRVNALRGVSLQANAGEVFGLLGPNGAGKTTLIKVLLGVVKPSSGQVSLFGEAVGSAAARRRVGYLPESLCIDPHHTARSALRYYGRLSRMSRRDIDRRSDELLDLVGLSGRDKESVRRFSKGMRQRLGLAQSLMHDPDLLVLDEPTDGLDPVGRSEVRNVIDRLREEGKTIFLNSHILQEVELVCSRVAIMSQGIIRGSGRLDELADLAASRVVIETRLPSRAGAEADRQQNRSSLLACLRGFDDGELQTEELAGGVDHFRITVVAPDQTRVDGIVDQLRAAGISIHRLENIRPSLEDTFMKLVGDDKTPADSTPADSVREGTGQPVQRSATEAPN